MPSESGSLDATAALAIIYAAVEQLNRQLPAEQRLAQSPDAVVTGAGSTLDSLSIITLLVSVEQSAGERGVTISLLDHPELGAETGPFRTLGALAALLSGGQGLRA
jgi:hypothetical protein